MIELIDTIFTPLLDWLIQLRSYMDNLRVPLSRPLRLAEHFGYLTMFGTGWLIFIETIIGMSVTYCILFVMVNGQDMILKFKNLVKWW